MDFTQSPRTNSFILIALTVTVLASGAIGGVALGGGTVSAQTGGDAAAISIVHASPDAPPVTVSVDGEPIATDVAFGTVTDYQAVEPGTRSIEITAANGENATLFAGEIDVEAGETYTVAAAGEVTEGGDTSFNPLVLADNATIPSSNESTVRFVHLSPDAPPVDVINRESNTVLFENVSYGETTDSVTVPAGNYTLGVRSAGGPSQGENVATVSVSLEGETANTAFAAGYLRPGSAPADTPFDLLLATDTTTDGERSRSSGNES